MTTYILVGESTINHYENGDWKEFEESILENNNGDIIGWDNATDSVGTLLDMLNGWHYFIELGKEDLDNIRNNTKIEIL